MQRMQNIEEESDVSVLHADISRYCHHIFYFTNEQRAADRHARWRGRPRQYIYHTLNNKKAGRFQTTKIVKRYTNVSEARNAIQRNEIYAFLYIPEGTTSELLSMRQPKISFYYSSTSLTAGALLYRDLKTISTLGSAGAASSVLQAKGLTESQIMSFCSLSSSTCIR